MKTIADLIGKQAASILAKHGLTVVPDHTIKDFVFAGGGDEEKLAQVQRIIDLRIDLEAKSEIMSN